MEGTWSDVLFEAVERAASLAGFSSVELDESAAAGPRTAQSGHALLADLSGAEAARHAVLEFAVALSRELGAASNGVSVRFLGQQPGSVRRARGDGHATPRRRHAQSRLQA